MKSKDLIKIIRVIVQQEIKKELPNALSQCFQNLMKTSMPLQSAPNKELPTPSVAEDSPEDEMASLKGQLKEMLNGGVPISSPKTYSTQKKSYTKNPVLNEILNQTRSTSEYERANGQSASRFAMTPAAAMASAYEGAPTMATTGMGELMSNDELSFMNKIPGMPGSDAPVISRLPTSAGKMLSESQAPMAGLPETVSALDIKNHPALPDSIKNVLKRDYRSLVKAMDKKRQ